MRRVRRKNNLEHQIQSDITAVLRLHRCEVHRMNVGLFYTKDGRRVRTGVEPGFPDLFGVKLDNQKAFMIEVKTPTGKIQPSQINFHHMLMHNDVIHGIARSMDDALKIVDEELVGYGYPDTKDTLWL